MTPADVASHHSAAEAITMWPIYLRHGAVFLACTLRLPRQPNGRALVYSHGWGGGRDAPHHADLLDHLAAAGVTSLTLDQRGYGDSTGQRDLAAWPADMAVLVEYLTERGLATWVGGLSTGGAMAIVTASRSANARGVIALSPFASLAHLLRERPERAEFLADRFGPLDAARLAVGEALDQVGRVAPRPLALVCAADDQEFPATHAAALFAAAGEPKMLWTLDQAGHTLVNTDRRALFDRLLSWMDRP